ncbi:MAG: nucleoside recognition protein, partial [Planctomycetota bacterium]
MGIRYLYLFALLCLAIPALRPVSSAAESTTPSTLSSGKGKRVKPLGETGRALEQSYKENRDTGFFSGYTSWKRRLPFWPRKLAIFLELGLLIAIGVIAGQALEMTGILNRLSIIAWPLLKLGALPRQAGMAFIMSFQSGRIANTMLVSYRDEGAIDNRELYTSVLIVSCFSLFAHLPTFVIPFGASLGWEAAIAFFAVRLVSISVEIVLVLTASRWLIRPWFESRFGSKSCEQEGSDVGEGREFKEKVSESPFHRRLWKRSRRTLLRLLFYMVPTFVLMAGLEYAEAFKWLARELPGLFAWSFLPSQAPFVVAAQAVNLYNGAMAAANFVDMGE